MPRKRLVFIVFGLAISWCLFLVGLLQIDTMFWDAVSYDVAVEWIWIPELGLSLKDSFRVMWLMSFLGMIAIHLVWFFARKIK